MIASQLVRAVPHCSDDCGDGSVLVPAPAMAHVTAHAAVLLLIAAVSACVGCCCR